MYKMFDEREVKKVCLNAVFSVTVYGYIDVYGISLALFSEFSKELLAIAFDLFHTYKYIYFGHSALCESQF